MDISIKAMILAAGRGDRLRPLTDRMPKCMVPIGGKPLLEHTIEWLAQCGVTDVIINLFHLPHVVMDHFQDGHRWGIRIEYSIEDHPLGTAGGVRNAAWFFDGPFFLWYGDNLSRCDLKRLNLFHRNKGGSASIALYQRDDVSQSGIVGIDGDDRIVGFLEKPRSDQVFSNLVNAGIYLLDPRIFDWIPKEGASDFALDVFPAMLANGQAMYGYRLSQKEELWWIDRPEDLANLSKRWKTE
jgi:NDP-sugar pyrophosphorylase family protein